MMEQKVVLITGGSRGIGAATARRFAAGGCKVVINYHRSQAQAEALAAEIGGWAVQADVADPVQVGRMVDPFGKYLVFILLFLSLCRNKTTGSVSERIFSIFIDCFLLSKSSYRSICPINLFTPHFQIKGSIGGIIIYNDFILLCISFAGSIDNRSCIFQHWNYIRKDKRLSEHVFCGAE